MKVVFNNTAKVFIFFLFTFFAFLQAKEVGKVTRVEGMADVLREGKMPAIPLKEGDIIHEKDIIRTKSGAKVDITFKDGSILKIAQRSRVDISEYVEDDGRKIQIGLPRGKVKAIVEKEFTKRIAETPKANRFEIKTPVAVAGVRGTEFFVYHEGPITGVLVEKGLIEVYNLKIPDVKVILKPGEKTLITENKPPRPPFKAPEPERKRLDKEVAFEVEGEPAREEQVSLTVIESPPPVQTTLAEIPTPVMEEVPETTPPITEENQEVFGEQPPVGGGQPSTHFKTTVGTLRNYGFMSVVSNGLLFPTGPGEDIQTQIAGTLEGEGDLWSGSNVPITLSGRYNPSYSTNLFLLPFASQDNPSTSEVNNLMGLTPTAEGLLNGAGFLGFIAGHRGSISGAGYGIYVKDGSAGYFVVGGLSGSLNTDNSWNASAYMKAVPKGSTTYTPSDIYPGSSALTVSEGYGSTAGALNGNLYIKTYNLTDQNWGIFYGGSYGTVSSSGDFRLGVRIQRDYSSNPIYWYAFGNYDNTTKEGSISSPSSKVFGPDSIGFVGGSIFGGTSNESILTGVYSLSTPLTFGSGVGVLREHGFLKWNTTSGIFEPVGDLNDFGYKETQMTGYLGGTANLWGGNPTFEMLGDVIVELQDEKVFSGHPTFEMLGVFSSYYFNNSDKTFVLPLISHRPTGAGYIDNIGRQHLSSTGELQSDGSNNVGYWGYISGVAYSSTSDFKPFEAEGYALFAKSNGQLGFFKIHGVLGEFDIATGMWNGSGIIKPGVIKNIGDSTAWQKLHDDTSGLLTTETFNTGSYRPFSITDSNDNLIGNGYSSFNFIKTPYNLGLWRNEVGGFSSFTNINNANRYYGGYSSSDKSVIIGTYATGSPSSMSSELGIKVPTYGSFARADLSTPTTGILIGETLGRFDPTTPSNSVLQQVGLWLETNEFLNLVCPGGSCNTTGSGLNPTQQALKDLNVPVVEVGRASFSCIECSPNISSFSIDNMIFFANNAGEKALIWASSSVSGSYSSDPTTPHSILLTGSAGIINVYFGHWNSGKWSAGVYGYGINLGSAPNDNLSIIGGSAGTYSSGSISGTASGIVR